MMMVRVPLEDQPMAPSPRNVRDLRQDHQLLAPPGPGPTAQVAKEAVDEEEEEEEADLPTPLTTRKELSSQL